MAAFQLLGKTIEFSDDTMNFAECYGSYLMMQDGADRMLCAMYDEYGTFTNLVNRIETDCSRILSGFASTFVEKVIDAGFYDLSADIFWEEYVARITRQLETVSFCDSMIEKYIELEREKEDVKRYREYRKDTRGRIVGGGFGLGGAIGGIAMAETANMLSGLGHSVANAIGNMGTDAAAQREGQKIYQNAQTRQRLRAALASDLHTIFQGYLLLLEDKLAIHFRVRQAEDKVKVDTVISNISSRELDREEAADMIAGLFQIDPYNDSLYRYALKRFGDSSLELQQIAEAFSMQNKLDGYKRAALKEIVDNMPAETIADCEKVMESLSDAIRRNGVSEEAGKEYLAVFQERMDTLDREMRTFRDTVYDTAKEAQKAREAYEAEQAELEREKEDLERWKSETDFTSKESLRQLREKIAASNYRVEEAGTFLEEIDHTLEQIDREERTVEGVVYEDHESARAAVRQKEAYEICRDAVFEKLREMIDRGQYREAIDCLRQMDLADGWKPKMETEWNDYIAVRFADEIAQSREYQKVLKESGVKNMVMGAGGIILIGLIVSFMFPYALPIAIVIAVLGAVSTIAEAKKNESRKPADQFVQQLIQCGYKIQTDKNAEGKEQ
ncbi:MAG: hypothetical protein NC302_02895 [Bacteroidales bacterium]|nr:hypothetical protein [Bacteroidales bacterium]MCM1414605.1 hypothetical protein [bacterium]MCM1423967.1 hypothetical protein [bacterium]